MASNLKVDIVKPTATNGSLSLKGDSGGSATTNGISVDSSGDTSITGTTSLDGAVIINESGADVDFRVEASGEANALFVQGSDGYVGIGVASPADKLHVDGNIRLTSGGGINFSAYATSGNPSSNLLDDYEEGTFTPTVSWETGSGNESSSGRYTKIGRIVSVQIAIDVTSSGGTGILSVSNLPFISINESQAGSGAERGNTGKSLVVWVNASSTELGIRYYDYTDVGTTSGDDIRVSIVYETT